MNGLNPYISIMDLMIMVERETDIPMSDYLKFGIHTLNTSMSIGDYNIQSGNTVYQLMRLRGDAFGEAEETPAAKRARVQLEAMIEQDNFLQAEADMQHEAMLMQGGEPQGAWRLRRGSKPTPFAGQLKGCLRGGHDGARPDRYCCRSGGATANRMPFGYWWL